MKTERLNKERVMYNALAVRVTDMGSMPMETLVMPRLCSKQSMINNMGLYYHTITILETITHSASKMRFLKKSVS